MKTFNFLLAVFFVSVTIISCGKGDDNQGNPATSPLYGSWTINTLNVSGCADPLANHSTNCAAGGALCSGAIVEFTRTTMTSTGVTGTNSSAYTISGNTFNYPSDGGVPTSFAIAGNTLTLSQQQSASNGGCLIVSTYTRN